MAPPELPDPTEDELRPTEAQHAPIVSDESDNEPIEYDGYQPLALDDFNMESDEQENVEDISMEQTNGAIGPDLNLPAIERAEIEIERQVWNAPRPQESQNIELDGQRTAQILSAMANFTLPNVSLPEWVTEERWKEELLQRIRQRKEQQESLSDEQKT